MSTNSRDGARRSLLELRLRAGLSSRRLAELAGLSQNAILYTERGDSVPHPKTRLAIAIALSKALGEPIDVLDLWPVNDERIAA